MISFNDLISKFHILRASTRRRFCKASVAVRRQHVHAGKTVMNGHACGDVMCSPHIVLPMCAIHGIMYLCLICTVSMFT